MDATELKKEKKKKNLASYSQMTRRFAASVVQTMKRDYGRSNYDVGEILGADRELARMASWMDFNWSPKVLEDPVVVMHWVRGRPEAVRCVSAELRADKEIGMVVVRREGFFIIYLDESLRDDEEVVLAAMLTDAHYGYQWASDRLKKDTAFLDRARGLGII